MSSVVVEGTLNVSPMVWKSIQVVKLLSFKGSVIVEDAVCVESYMPLESRLVNQLVGTKLYFSL